MEIDSIREWPQVEHGDIYNHLILSRASDGEETEKFKSMDSYFKIFFLFYDYFKSGSVGIFFNSP